MEKPDNLPQFLPKPIYHKYSSSLIQPQVPKKQTYGENTTALILPQVLKKSTCGRIFYFKSPKQNTFGKADNFPEICSK